MVDDNTGYVLKDLISWTEHLDVSVTKFNSILCSSLQVFHMLEREENGDGGLSTVVDGFKVAEILKQENPLHFKVLTEVELETEYLEPEFNCRMTGPVIRIDRATNEVCQIR